MKRTMIGFTAVLAMSLAFFSAPSSAGASTKAKIHESTAQCAKAAKGHSRVTKSELSSCKTVSTTISHHCPNGPTLLLVRTSKDHFALRQGHEPVRLKTKTLFVSIARLCGDVSNSATTTTSTSTTSTTTTTTTPPPPPTTTPPRPPSPITTTTRAPAPPPPPPPTTVAPAGCYPLSNENTCYEPGEYCRDDNHGQTGRAGDGETITCEDNNGWRWEPT